MLAAFPREARRADAELAALSALDELTQGLADSAERNLDWAEQASAAVPAARTGQLHVLLGVARLLLGRQRGNLSAVTKEARLLPALAEVHDSERPALGEDLHALGLTSLGIAEVWAGQFPDARLHLEQGLAVARRIGRPYLEFTNLAFLPVAAARDSIEPGVELSVEAMELARRHGWTGDSAAGIASTRLGISCAWRARLAEAEDWVQHAESVILAETDPSAILGVRYVRGLLENARGRHSAALAVLRSAESLAETLTAPLYVLVPVRALLTHALVRLGQLARAEQAIAETERYARQHGEMRVAAAEFALACADPLAAIEALGPAVDGTAGYLGLSPSAWHARALLVEADARDRLGDRAAADRALERALDVTETSGALTPFLLHPVRDLLARHSGHRTSHGALIADIGSLLAGAAATSSPAGPDPLDEPLSKSELRVLRYLPTNLAAPEVAEELSISLNTVKTHMRNIYAKLGAHRRAEAVDRARALGLLAPAERRNHTAQAKHTHPD